MTGCTLQGNLRDRVLAQPPFVPRPMFRNPEFGHENGGLAGTMAAGLRKRTMASTASPLESISRAAATGPGGDDHMTTKVHTRSQIDTTTVRVMRRDMRGLFLPGQRSCFVSVL
jgi:hypothetical protein